MRNNDLVVRDRMPPLLMAPGSTDPQKAVMAKNSEYAKLGPARLVRWLGWVFCFHEMMGVGWE
jgi:hypothetical protein